MAFSYLATPSATIAVLKRHGLYTSKSLGQHFLVDDNIVGRILDLADLTGDEHVVEVGPGIGTLTCSLASRATSVVAIERDARLAPALEEVVRRTANVRVVFADALDVPLDDLRDAQGRPPTALVANLPYSVAATVVLRFFEQLTAVAHATVMVQAEVADRMGARPGTKEYGAYTVKLALRARLVGRFAVSRSCFLPPPRVDSAVVRLERVFEWTDSDIAVGVRAAEAAFSQRRKTARNAIASSLSISSGAVAEAMRAAGLDPESRAETFDPPAFVALGHALRLYGLLP